jgi:hypothetical protein|tara:strand:- start:71 stop:172 length:102 start_codon:yes stop_codon:yes gene_type:complete
VVEFKGKENENNFVLALDICPQIWDHDQVIEKK